MTRRHWIGSITLIVTMAFWLGAGMSVPRVAAHAVPERGEPPIDGVVADRPERVDVWFSEEVVGEGTSLAVLTADGNQVDRGETTLDLDDPERRHVYVELEQNIEPGTFLVQWQSESAIDDDIVSGSYRFTYDPDATPEADLAPIVTPTVLAQEATPVPVPFDAVEDVDNGTNWTLVIGIGAAVIVALGLALLLLRKQQRSSPDRP
jgi:methionine-rich copper-binding protein CopC